MTGGGSAANDNPVLLVTKQVESLLVQLHQLEAQMELMEQAAMLMPLMPASATALDQDVAFLLTKSECQPTGKLERPYIVAATPPHPHRELPLEIEPENIQILPTNSERQPIGELEQQDVGLVAATPLHPHGDLPLEIESENASGMLEKELVTKIAFEATQFDQYSSGMLSAVVLTDEALPALSTMPAAGLLHKESTNSPVLREGRNQTDDLAMTHVVLADDVPAVRTQHVQELPMAHPAMPLNDEVPVKLSLERRASRSPAVNVERTLALEIIPAERTLKNEAAHALALVNGSSTQHCTTLPEWQTAARCVDRSFSDVKCPSIHDSILSTESSTVTSTESSTATGSSIGPHSKDSLGSPCSSYQKSLRIPTPSSIPSRSSRIAADDRFAFASLHVGDGTSVAIPRRRPQSHSQYFQARQQTSKRAWLSCCGGSAG
mmetsp:Transcript_2106/g.3867  ORF Transcript_2106/g.3867 Transcript_2106/m.3867 type:complete len:436 (+) Transcript_2106:60-1367(+)